MELRLRNGKLLKVTRFLFLPEEISSGRLGQKWGVVIPKSEMPKVKIGDNLVLVKDSGEEVVLLAQRITKGDNDNYHSAMLEMTVLEKIMNWTDVQQPNQQIPYTHIISPTPLGVAVINWKGWKGQKELPDYYIEIGERWVANADSLDSAKQKAEDYLRKKRDELDQWLGEGWFTLAENVPEDDASQDNILTIRVLVATYEEMHIARFFWSEKKWITDSEELLSESGVIKWRYLPK